MGRGIARFFVHSITVQSRVGATATGRGLSAPVTVPCFIDGGVKVNRTTDGTLVVASAPVYAPVEFVAALTPNSEVTMPDGRKTTVVAVTVHTSGPLGLPDHLEIVLE